VININFVKILSTFVIVATLFSLIGINFPASSATVDDYLYSYGPIASINGDWVLAGSHMAYNNPSNISDSGFHSTFSMVMKNGSGYHMHQMSNATGEDISMEGNNTIYQGSVTVTMRDGPVSNVPTTWTVFNNNTLAISMDPTKINNHFGDTPIYGLELTSEKEMELINLMSEDSKFMDKWVPLMLQNTMKELNIDSGNMSMTNQSTTNESMDTMFINNSTTL
jgi:hypothetical protein